jgi:hypothetical protein
MRPRQINVFDGLRITTEHLDHLQGAFLTGLQDLREASGLGRVVRGFEVGIEGDGRVSVQPGLAFDREKNRIVSDEPRVLDAVFQEGEESLWITIRYEQEESGEIEGKQTLIWDGCTLELTATEPGPDDLALPIARLMRAADGQLTVLGPGERPPEAGITDADDAPPASSPPTDTSQPPPALPRLTAAQGMTRLANLASPLGTPLSSLAAAVRGRVTPPAEGDSDPSLALATDDIVLNFTPVGLTCQVILSASVVAESRNGASSDRRAAVAPLQSTSWGEVAIDGETLTQHALTQCATGGQDRAVAPWSLLTDGVVAHLPLSAWADAAEPSDDESVAAVGSAAELAACRYLHLAARVARDATRGVQVILSLDWKGGVDDDRMRSLETTTVRMQVEALLAWSALGTA